MRNVFLIVVIVFLISCRADEKRQEHTAFYDDVEKKAAEKRHQLMMQNNVGHPANDFVFVTPAGTKKVLYRVDAKYLLVLFYNPECEACKEMKNMLIASPVINKKLSSGELRILAVYIDKDETVWRKHLPEMPAEWIHGRDADEYLYKNNIYDLRAIPTIYLLDENKKVLLKDCVSIIEIERRIIGE
ncbi:MAG: thioredoxin family protein [Chitinophagaceae bacterium]